MLRFDPPTWQEVLPASVLLLILSFQTWMALQLAAAGFLTAHLVLSLEIVAVLVLVLPGRMAFVRRSVGGLIGAGSLFLLGCALIAFAIYLPRHAITVELVFGLGRLVLFLGTTVGLLLGILVAQGRRPYLMPVLRHGPGARWASCIALLALGLLGWKVWMVTERLRFFRAALQGQEATCARLARRHASFAAESFLDNPMLNLAARSGSLEAVRCFLDAGASTAVRDLEQATPIHTALEMPLDRNATIIRMTADQMSALDQERARIIRLLLERGADPNAENNRGASPINRAVQRGWEACVRVLLEGGADIRRGPSEKAPLHGAIRYGHTRLIPLFLERGADLKDRDWQGRSPLLAAVGWGNGEAVELLLKAGADITATDTQGRDVWTLLKESETLRQSPGWDPPRVRRALEAFQRPAAASKR